MISVFTFVGDWFRVENVEYRIHHVTWHTYYPIFIQLFGQVNS